ncbi:CBS domain-containing protein [Halogranum rubrum]|uniref:CBS domain-containing protein n=1 Tax=Halogranum rubrum TaxID=553466 RepID=A0A1I4I4P7_9EURY|nr:CBS domain-containing protein [Halogranum rubrum]SFL49087.1 CBS domain-containing protein [Halogranum rubrum]
MIETSLDGLFTDSSPTVSPTTMAADAAQQLRTPKTHALVVVNETDRVVGIVTESDIVALIAEERTELTVAEFMSSPPVTTTPETSVLTAAKLMRESGVKHLPVVADGSYRGLVSASDLVPYVSRRRLEITWQGEPFSASDVTETDDPELQVAD